MNRRPKPGRARESPCAPIATPDCTAVAHTRRMMVASLAWKPQATLALVTTRSRASSSPRVHWPKPSPRSEFRPTAHSLPHRELRGGSGAAGGLGPAPVGGALLRRLLGTAHRLLRVVAPGHAAQAVDVHVDPDGGHARSQDGGVGRVRPVDGDVV